MSTPAPFTYPEACDSLRISRSKLYQLVEVGDIKVAHLGRSARSTRTELNRFVSGFYG
ncbi:MAG: helix-turn-helix domain-containing protein [Ferrimicrobium sp.]